MNSNSTPSSSPDQQGRRNLWILAVFSFLRGAHNSIYNVIWQPFVLSLGASIPTLGLLNSLGGLNGGVTTLVQPLGGWFADRLGHKPFVIVSSFAVLAAYLLFVLSGSLNIWPLLVIGVVCFGISAISRPALSAMTAESVALEQRGRAFGLIAMATMIPGVFMPMLSGWSADRFGYLNVFTLMIALEALGLFLVWRYIAAERHTHNQGITWQEGIRALRRSSRPPKGLVGFFCAVAGDSLFWGMGWGILYGMLNKDYHFTIMQLAIMHCVMSLTWVVSQIPIGRYIDKHGSKGMLIFSEALGIPLMLIWMSTTRFEIFVASQILFGLTASTWVPTVNTFLTHQVSDTERAEA
ncbi:MAG: MFS transporter, partial [Desulfobacteraceae bacterium]